MEQLTKIGFQLNIWHNGHLKTLKGLENLEAVGEALNIEGNHDLKDLAGLDSLRSIGRDKVRDGGLVGGLKIQNNLSLVSLKGLSQLEEVFGQLRFLKIPS